MCTQSPAANRASAARMPGCESPLPRTIGSTLAAVNSGASDAYLKQRSLAHLRAGARGTASRPTHAVNQAGF
eukprot:236751-Chlamydomonas_euryale.AAC.1